MVVSRWLIFVTGCLLLISSFYIVHSIKTEPEKGRCYPTDHPTGRLYCWSDGVIVLDELIYRNGGVLCSADGRELKVSEDTCVEEIRQDPWNPPAEKIP